LTPNDANQLTDLKVIKIVVKNLENAFFRLGYSDPLKEKLCEAKYLHMTTQQNASIQNEILRSSFHKLQFFETSIQFEGNVHELKFWRRS